MNIIRNSFVVASLVCGAAFVTKIALIAAADGGDSTLISAMWFVGTLSFLAASGLGAAYVLRDRARWMRIVAGIAAVPLAFTIGMGPLDTVIKSIYQSEGWFRDELSLIVIGVVYAGLGLRVLASGKGARFESRAARHA